MSNSQKKKQGLREAKRFAQVCDRITPAAPWLPRPKSSGIAGILMVPWIQFRTYRSHTCSSLGRLGCHGPWWGRVRLKSPPQCKKKKKKPGIRSDLSLNSTNFVIFRGRGGEQQQYVVILGHAVQCSVILSEAQQAFYSSSCWQGARSCLHLSRNLWTTFPLGKALQGKKYIKFPRLFCF